MNSGVPLPAHLDMPTRVPRIDARLAHPRASQARIDKLSRTPGSRILGSAQSGRSVPGATVAKQSIHPRRGRVKAGNRGAANQVDGVDLALADDRRRAGKKPARAVLTARAGYQRDFY